MSQFVCEDEISAAEFDAGVLTPWRVDPITGKQWYRRESMTIRGVTQSPEYRGEIVDEENDE